MKPITFLTLILYLLAVMAGAFSIGLQHTEADGWTFVAIGFVLASSVTWLITLMGRTEGSD